ncbi:MAG: hypothetical protein AAGG07_02610 [Planctomycetota bacterium]
MRHTLFATVAAVAIIASPAIAQPVVGSDPQFGPGSITIDPDQTLDFLDLTVTNGISLAAMQTQLMSGGTYEGWRYATRGEIVSLINSLGWPSTLSDQQESDSFLDDNARPILEDFIGVTDAFDFFGDDYILGTGYLENGNAIRITWGEAKGGESYFDYITPESQFAPEFQFNPANTGHWLVRTTRSSPPTYQGTLGESGTPFDGTADFRATLLSGGGAPLETIEHTEVSVANGLFTIPLSFDPALFETSGAMLRMEVRAPSGVGDYEAVTPDQPLSPAPSAVFAERAALADVAINASTAMTAETALNADAADAADVALALSNEASVALPLSAGAEPYGVGYRGPVVSRSGNLVVLNGLVRDVGISNTIGTTFATLPAGFRPTARLLFFQASSAGMYRVDIQTNGQIQFQGAPGVGGEIDWISLDGVSFTLE